MSTISGFGRIDDPRPVSVSPSRHYSELFSEQVGQAIEHSSLMVIITDAGGRIEYVNPCLSATTGYRLEDIVGKSPRILKSGHSPEAEYRKLWSTIRQGENWRGEFCNRRKDGTLYWSSAAISPVKGVDGTITHFVAVQVDIGEQKRIEQELRLSDQRFRSLAETCLLGICIERDNRPLFVNQKFAEIYGYESPAEVVQLRSLDTLYVQDDLTRVIRSRQKHARAQTSLPYEVRGVKETVRSSGCRPRRRLSPGTASRRCRSWLWISRHEKIAKTCCIVRPITIR